MSPRSNVVPPPASPWQLRAAIHNGLIILFLPLRGASALPSYLDGEDREVDRCLKLMKRESLLRRNRVLHHLREV